MINLLPYTHKREIRAARANVVLVNYLTMLAGAIIVMLVMVGAVFVLLQNSQMSANVRVEENNSKLSSYKTVRERANQFRSDLSSAKTILDGEVTYSQLIYNIANVIPSGVVLDNLSLDSQTLGSKVTMNANARTYNDAIRMKEIFISKPDLFSDVSFETLSYTPPEGETPDKYPVKVSMSVIIKKDVLNK